MVVQSIKQMVAENSVEVTKAAQELRKNFFEWYDINSNEFHEADVKRLREDDFYCQRFILHKKALDGGTDSSMKLVKHVFKWRKEFGVNDIKDSEFSEEFVKSQAFYPYRRDKEGNVTIMFEICKYDKDSKTATLRRRYFVYLLEEIEKKYGGRQQVVFIGNCNNAGLRNIDMDWTFFMQGVIVKNYPAIFEKNLAFNMPWIFNAAWKLLKSWLPKESVERVVFVDDKTILDYIDAEDLPESMGGLDKTVYPLEDRDPMSGLPASLLTVSQAIIPTN